MVHTEKRLSLAEIARAKTGDDQPQDVAARLAKPAVALDIRWPDDVAEDHVPGAMNLCHGTPDMNIKKALSDLDTMILCVCNAKNRGSLFAATLNDTGYAQARSTAGGRNVWRKTMVAV